MLAIGRVPYNLNEMSHNAAISMISELLRMKVRVSEVYIDTVGPAAKYEAKLNQTFNFTNIKFKVAAKADSLYKCVSAASIVAKVCLRRRFDSRRIAMRSSSSIPGRSRA